MHASVAASTEALRAIMRSFEFSVTIAPPVGRANVAARPRGPSANRKSRIQNRKS
jgi:hypothetical protein